MPDQPLLAVHDVAFDDDQVNVIDDPSVIEVLSAESETVGAGVCAGVLSPPPPPPPPQAASSGATRPIPKRRRFNAGCQLRRRDNMRWPLSMFLLCRISILLRVCRIVVA